MKWQEVRNLYPHQWVKISILQAHMEGDRKIVDDMEVIKVLSSDEEAGDELGKCEKNGAVYHTFHEEISFKMTRLFGFRRRQCNNENI